MTNGGEGDRVRISAEEVRTVACLAGLRLTGEEVDRLSKEMAVMLGHFEALNERASPPGGMGEVGERDRLLRLRLDETSSDPLLLPPETNAPEWREGFFVVPRVPGVKGRDSEGGDGR